MPLEELITLSISVFGLSNGKVEILFYMLK